MFIKYIKLTKLIPLALSLGFAIILFISTPPFNVTTMTTILIGIIILGIILIIAFTIIGYLNPKSKLKKKQEKAVLSNEVIALILFVLFILFASRISNIPDYKYALVQGMVFIYTIFYTIYIFLQIGLLGNKRNKKFSRKQ